MTRNASFPYACMRAFGNTARQSVIPEMFRLPVSIAIVLAIVFFGAITSVVFALKVTSGFGSIQIGQWKAWPRAHTADADPYAKAHRARSGKVLLAGAEGLVFVAETDMDGNRLVSSCNYEISGKTPPARFWTIHMTDMEDRLFSAGEPFPSAYHSYIITRDPAGAFSILVSRRASAGNWLASPPGDAPFKLVLTLFDTPAAASTRIDVLEMPTVASRGCHDA